MKSDLNPNHSRIRKYASTTHEQGRQRMQDEAVATRESPGGNIPDPFVYILKSDTDALLRGSGESRIWVGGGGEVIKFLYCPDECQASWLM
ncbi:hypothetical protein AVEN_55793-1 [Araneus ventricosus]|uniref:Uncharacterized protein n=1 Tax=Araneus ventricosus TaxID=182803 RepID=A0A4Y2F081_ARAVE|nr:hypothetical protein AVEN_55793-1 [Araneus ventricosus]